MLKNVKRSLRKVKNVRIRVNWVDVNHLFFLVYRCRSSSTREETNVDCFPKYQSGHHLKKNPIKIIIILFEFNELIYYIIDLNLY